MKLARLTLAQALRSGGMPVTDRDALRTLVDGSDYLGTDIEGDAWLLVRTTPQLLNWLATMDAATEDDEDNRDDEQEDEELDHKGSPAWRANPRLDEDCECDHDREWDPCDEEPDHDTEYSPV